jgi:hypothetical protein
MGEIAMKIGKTYDEADRQYFRGYIEHRAQFRPSECCGGSSCWVEFGPPALTSARNCVGCGGAPAIPYRQAYRGPKYAR